MHLRDKDKYWCIINGKMNVDIASLQRRVLMRLLGKGKCWCKFMVMTSCKDKCGALSCQKTSASTTSLQGLVLVLLHCQHKSQYDFKDMKRV